MKNEIWCFKLNRERHWYALSSRVLVVASVNKAVGDWAVYIDAVPGHNHELEWSEVAKHGTKVSKEMGELLFPEFKEYRWRY